MNKIPILIPMLMTLGNVSLGITSIVLVMKGYFEIAGLLIFIASILDSMDGWTARKLGVDGQFGAKADTVADVVSFGFAPAVFIMRVSGDILGIIAAVLYVILIISRLIRYHLVKTPKGVFIGIPSPMAAMPVVAIAVLTARGDFPDFAPLIGMVFFGGLAISPIRFPGWYHRASKFLPGIGMPIFYLSCLILFFIWNMETLLGMHLFYAIFGPLLLARSEKKHSAYPGAGE